MHIQTHLLSGWCAASLLPLTPRERGLAMVAATAPDLDGLGILISYDHYLQHHHILGHNLPFGLLLTGILTAFSDHKARAGALYLGLFHLHLLMDFYGSGFGWGIPYFWPFSTHEFISLHSWPLFSWQNLTAFGLLLAWTGLIAIRQHRTPLESLMPSLDQQLVRFLRRTPKTP